MNIKAQWPRASDRLGVISGIGAMKVQRVLREAMGTEAS